MQIMQHNGQLYLMPQQQHRPGSYLPMQHLPAAGVLGLAGPLQQHHYQQPVHALSHQLNLNVDPHMLTLSSMQQPLQPLVPQPLMHKLQQLQPSMFVSGPALPAADAAGTLRHGT
jgi:hypothetical protein